MSMDGLASTLDRVEAGLERLCSPSNKGLEAASHLALSITDVLLVHLDRLPVDVHITAAANALFVLAAERQQQHPEVHCPLLLICRDDLHITVTVAVRGLGLLGCLGGQLPPAVRVNATKQKQMQQAEGMPVVST